MNNKGFTLIEILVVIAIIGLVLGLGIPGIIKLRENINKRSFNSKTKIIEDVAVIWGNNNKSLLESDICIIESKNKDCYKISVETLIEEDYLNSEKKDEIYYSNPKDNSNLSDNCVYVYKQNNRVYAKFSETDKAC